MYIHMYVHIYVYTCVYIYMYIWLKSPTARLNADSSCSVYKCLYVSMCIWICVYMCICIYVYMYMYMDMRICVCICAYAVCTYVYMCICGEAETKEHLSVQYSYMYIYLYVCICAYTCMYISKCYVCIFLSCSGSLSIWIERLHTRFQAPHTKVQLICIYDHVCDIWKHIIWSPRLTKQTRKNPNPYNLNSKD